MADETNATEQNDTSIDSTVTENQDTTNNQTDSTNTNDTGNDTNNTENKEGDDTNKSNLADAGESDEVKFTKEYIGKPEAYDYKDVEVPEGMTLNEDLTKKFETTASKYNMSQKGANELMAMAVDLAKQTQQGVLIAQSQQVEAKKAEYIKTLQTDKEIGGAKLDNSLKTANFAYEKFIPNDVQDLFAQNGLNCHPSVVKMFYEVGKQMQDDSIHSANNATSNTKKSEAELLYGSTTALKKN